MTLTKSGVDKQSLAIGPGRPRRFTPDHNGGSTVSFAHIPNGTLVLLEGGKVLGKDNLTVLESGPKVTLRYTTEEWRAFTSGVHDGEFDVYTSGQPSDLIPLRDSKDPDGPVLVFSVAQMASFLRAVRLGKYDLE